MRLSFGARVVSVAVVALLVLTVFAAVGAFGRAPAAAAGPRTSHPSAVHLAAPAVVATPTASHAALAAPPASGSPSGSVVISTVFQVYMAVPFWVFWNISTVNVTTINASSVAQSVAVVSLTDGSTVVNRSVTTVTAQHNYSALLNQKFLKSSYASGLLPEGQYQLAIWLTVTNGVGSATVNGLQTFQLAAHPETGTILTPTPGTLIAGNITIAGVYNGSYVNSANVTVFSSGIEVFFQGVFTPGTPNQAQAFAVSWLVTVAGSYTINLNLGAPYGSKTVSEAVAVKSVPTTTYVNTTTYSLVPGLGAGGSAALLLVVGLVVGMIVAWAVARSSYKTAAPGPAQPWTEKKGMHECSVCHQTFATEEELKEHAKTAHGITM